MPLKLIEGAEELVITLEDAKKSLHVDTNADDDHIAALVDAAVGYIEIVTGRKLRRQTWQLTLPGFPDPTGRIELPYGPTVTVSSVTYLDGDGTEQTLAASQYRVAITSDFFGAEILLAADVTDWPTSVQTNQPDAVRVIFDTGYVSTTSPEDNAVPKALIQAILMMVRKLYDEPGAGDIPPVVETLIAPFKVNRFGGVRGVYATP